MKQLMVLVISLALLGIAALRPLPPCLVSGCDPSPTPIAYWCTPDYCNGDPTPTP